MTNISILPETYFGLILHFWDKAQHTQLSDRWNLLCCKVTQQLDEIFNGIQLVISWSLSKMLISPSSSQSILANNTTFATEPKIHIIVINFLKCPLFAIPTALNSFYTFPSSPQIATSNYIK